MTIDARDALEAWYQRKATQCQQHGFKAVLSARRTADNVQQTRLKVSSGCQLTVMSLTTENWVEITELNLLNDGFRRQRLLVSGATEAEALFTAAWQRFVG